MGCVSFDHGVVSDSLDLKFFSTNVDPACLVTCNGHVSFSENVHAVQVHEIWVWAIISMQCPSTFISHGPPVVSNAISALESSLVLSVSGSPHRYPGELL